MKNAQKVANARSRGKIIANSRNTPAEANDAVLSLIFAKGRRPGADAVAQVAAAGQGPVPFVITHFASLVEGWVELLATGLTFDCRGLSPARAQRTPARGQLLGLAEAPAGEALALLPGPHLAGGRGMLPVVRALAGIGAAMARLPGVQAVCWEPARTWMEPAYFQRVIADWLDGGAFPALGLTALHRDRDGAMVSVGLDFLTGQELRIEPDSALASAAAAGIAGRLIHELIGHGPLRAAQEFAGPGGETVEARPIGDGSRISVTVRR